MEWVERLRGTVVGVDSAPLIYFIEDDPVYGKRLSAFFEAVSSSRIRAVTSVVTLAEVLVRPLREGRVDLVRQYREILLTSTGFDTVPVSSEIADHAAQLRAAHGLRTPDAIQLATAMSAGATAFLTNDTRLAKTARLEPLLLAELRDD